MGTKQQLPVQAAELAWRGEVPVSQKFDDIYFSTVDGLAEAKQIFFDGNMLTERWQNKPQQFVIAETGFGAGLNFLASCKQWLSQAGESDQLHYVAVEKYPLKRRDIQRVLSQFSALDELLESFLRNYPPLVTGIHRLNLFGDRVYLSLAFMDVEPWLENLHIQADAWYLDGFAPARNPEMWSDTVLQGVASNTAQNGRFATFSAAGQVRRSLQQAGFQVEKVSGFGGKREALCGHAPAVPSATTRQPWFAVPRRPTRQRAAIIGAGLAGAFTADSLLRRGWQVSVIDRHTLPAREASGNRAGVIFSKLSAFDGLEYRFYQQAYLYAAMHLPQLLLNQQIWSQCGMLQLAFDRREQQRQQSLLQARLWPEEWLQYLDAEQASRVAGLPLQHSALFFPQSGWIAPAETCRYLLGRRPELQLLLENEIAALEYHPRNQYWRVLNRNGEVIVESEIVVIATAGEALNLSQTDFLPLKPIRGQITDLQQTAQSGELQTVLCFEGYLTPSVGWQHSLGATFDLSANERQASELDNERNIQKLQECEPGVYQALCSEEGLPQVTNARVGFRCHTPDYLPVVGPVPDLAFYRDAYAALAKGQKDLGYPDAQYLPGLFLNVGHGSRGITSTPISAEIIASYVNGEPQPINEILRHAIHPARFPVKQMIRSTTVTDGG